MENIKNFAIIAHIDHGKSTLADRFLEITETVPKEKLEPQYLDRLSLEREKGITIKMQPVTMNYKGYILNLIDTPGHVDFSYEVSRALASVEGVILLVDGTQGIQAQTIANLELAKKQNLKILPAINKIDLEIHFIENLIETLKELTGENEVYLVSAKYGTGVKELLDGIIKKIPSPQNKFNSESPSALIFDSHYDNYLGIVLHVRVFKGFFKKNQIAYLKHANYEFKILEVGIFKPDLEEKEKLPEGMIGYVATGIKDPGILKIGDTLVLDINTYPLPGYEEPKPVLFANVFPSEEITFENFSFNLNRFRLNDPAITLEPISSFWGRGYLVGFLGILHLEIFQERLKREFGTNVILTLPSVEYKINLKDGKSIFIKDPTKIPPLEKIKSIEEPFALVEIFTPLDYLESILNLIKENRGIVKENFYDGNVVKAVCEMPISELISGFYDDLKSVSSGYASLIWKFLDYRENNLVILDILVAEKVEPSLRRIVHISKAENIGRKILKELKESLQREEFPIKLQVSINGRIVARETIPAIWKNVAGWLYGGDRTRKMKLWKKQKEGKKKLQELGKGKVKIPNNILIKILKIK